jgi:tryptophanyl-tRNA synthetase
MSTPAKKRLLTGLQPSGSLHLGNYFGALKPFVDMYEDFDSHLMVVDYHALTTLRDAAALRENTLNIVKDYVAAGVDPEKAILFKQSDVPEHMELAWIFECLVTVPFLSQAHAYKDKVAKGIEPSAGLFNYPMLMAADILLYDTEVVPVGEDQRQHIEYTREAAGKFNRAYGETFTAPEERIMGGVGTIPGTDGQKMSKSYKNTIPLFGTKDETAKAVMSIVTDSSGSLPQHVYAIHRLFRPELELDALYKANAGQYKVLKEALIEDIEAVIAPMREKRDSITDDDVRTILADGAVRARERASAKMKDVREKIGIVAVS